MAQTGLTVALADIWLNTLRGVPWVGPLICLQLHDGAAGAAGTTNVFAGATRSAATYNAASGGSMALAASPLFNITAGGTLDNISAWTGFTGDPDAICLGTGQLLVPITVANGDRFSLGTCPIAFNAAELAS